MATPCAKCDRGPLKHRSDPLEPARTHQPVELLATCESCGHTHTFHFALPPDVQPDDRDNLYPIINPTVQPSRILDVGQWIVLFRVILEAAGNQKDKIEARRLGYEAAQCLEEAIKFYTDNDLPPPGALCCNVSRARFREHPEQFSKERLIEMRGKLPKLTTMKRQLSDGKKPRSGAKKPWWRWWG